MFVESMDCLFTFNLSCVNGTLIQLSSSSVILGDVLHPNLLVPVDSFNNESHRSTSQSIPSQPILVSLQHCIITAIILGGIILSTITGNILVIVAVIREKTLHSVAYYLFVSLAVADLMVASMVMPIAVLKEVTRSWILSPIICDIWVMIDLLCCTASILHLVAIALDRYWAITNLDYATKRTPMRVLILICIIWFTSILISSSHFFPIFRDKRGRPPDHCHLIGNVTYTIISTVGAFYIPLIGMCIIYWKIFQAAKFRIRRKAFNASQPTSPMLIYQHQEIPSPNHHQRSPLLQLKLLKKNHFVHDEIEPDIPSTYSSSFSHAVNDYQLKPLRKQTKSSEDDFQSVNYKKNSNPFAQRLLTSTSFAHDLPLPSIHTIPNPLASTTTAAAVTSNSSPSNSPHLHHTHLMINEIKLPRSSPLPSTAISRKKIDLKRERKATKVLGVVMGCFILCWLPFFLEETICGIFRLTINEKIFSVLTWLGYLNSLLNPVIYTIFAPDFRQAFGKILFGNKRKRQRLKK